MFSLVGKIVSTGKNIFFHLQEISLHSWEKQVLELKICIVTSGNMFLLERKLLFFSKKRALARGTYVFSARKFNIQGKFSISTKWENRCTLLGNQALNAVNYVSAIGNISVFLVDKGRKLNVNKTFRRHPGRLLNILCTFSLRPVCTGTVFSTEIINVANIG